MNHKLLFHVNKTSQPAPYIPRKTTIATPRTEGRRRKINESLWFKVFIPIYLLDSFYTNLSKLLLTRLNIIINFFSFNIAMQI